MGKTKLLVNTCPSELFPFLLPRRFVAVWSIGNKRNSGYSAFGGWYSPKWYILMYIAVVDVIPYSGLVNRE